MKDNNKKQNQGQSTVEYILLVTAVIAVVIIFLTTKDGLFQKRLTNTLDISTNSLENIAVRVLP